MTDENFNLFDTFATLANIHLGEHLLKVPWRRRLWKWTSRSLRKTSWRRLGRREIVTLKTSSRPIQDVLENKECLLGPGLYAVKTYQFPCIFRYYLAFLLRNHVLKDFTPVTLWKRDSTLGEETFAGWNVRDFRDFSLFLRKFQASKIAKRKIAKVFSSENKNFS